MLALTAAEVREHSKQKRINFQGDEWFAGLCTIFVIG